MHNIDSHGVVIQDIQRMLQKFEEAKSWLESFGLNVTSARFQKYKKIIANKYLSDIFRGLTDIDVLWALAELYDILEIYQFLESADKNQIKSALKHVNSGPYLLSDEKNDGGTIHGRNFTFELYTAARFIRAGIAAEFVTDADINFIFEDAGILVECKRINSESNMENLISKAFEQIKKRCSVENNTFGLIAISISKLIWKIQKDLGQECYGDIEKIQKNMAIFANDFSYNLRSIYEDETPACIGIIFHYKVPFFRKENGFPVFINRFSYVPFTKHSFGHKKLSSSLSKALRSSVYKNG
ncbi:hypothetical protein [Aeromonas hydrophila]|uniref:hypothetical protein n=1 Tax=Aeromonas hydrophila TaxID=644 RepID=UPI00126A5A53|nr:hypothetical protein [Aeromonas hydrophila]